MTDNLPAAASGAITGLAWSWARAVVANSKSRSATAASTVSNSSAFSRMWSAPAADPLGGDVRPAVARLDQAQPVQRKIAHGARGHADVLAELRLDEDHDRPGKVVARFGPVGPGHHFTF